MSQHPERSVSSPRATGTAIVSTLYAMAFIVGAIVLVAVLFQVGLTLGRKDSPAGADEIIRIVVTGVVGIAGAVALGAVGTILSYLHAQTQMMHRLVRAQEDCATYLSRMNTSTAPAPVALPAVPVENASPPASWVETQRLDHIYEALAEISDNLLLTPEQRQAKRCRMLQDTQRNLSETLERLLAAGNFTDAQVRLEQYSRLFLDDHKRVAEFQERIDQARAQVEQSDYEQAAAKLRDFMATAAWERADETVQELLRRHPKSQRVRDLVDNLHQERSRFEQQHRQQMLAQVEHLGSQRQWREAYRLASDLIARFPETAEGQILRARIHTIKENAEIEVRRELEEQFKEFLRSHRYIEALALAQDVVAKYPTSPQAKVLREQMPQLMSKAKMQMDQVGGR